MTRNEKLICDSFGSPLPCYLLASSRRGFALPSYRLYRLDGAGNIMTADWLEAAADDDALTQAHERVDGSRFELWDGDRLISSSRRSGKTPQ